MWMCEKKSLAHYANDRCAAAAAAAALFSVIKNDKWDDVIINMQCDLSSFQDFKGKAFFNSQFIGLVTFCVCVCVTSFRLAKIPLAELA
jgi:hypothetical protein